MPLLYESYATVQPNDVVTIYFETREPLDIETARNQLSQYNWTARGLQLINLKVHRKGGCVTLKVLPTFIAPLAILAIATIVPAALGFIATIAKLWVIREVASPLLQKGPLGLPIIAWILITAAGVLIPLAIILKRK